MCLTTTERTLGWLRLPLVALWFQAPAQYRTDSKSIYLPECRVAKSASYGRLPSLQGRSSPRCGGMSRRSKSPSSNSSGELHSSAKEAKTTAVITGADQILSFTANGTAGSQLSTPRSGKSPSPSPTSPASLRRRRVINIDFSFFINNFQRCWVGLVKLFLCGLNYACQPLFAL